MSHECYSISQLAERVNRWCSENNILPLHNGAGEDVTVRNIRYYQTIGLVDRPLNASGRGFTRKHHLQLVSIRRLQAKGLSLDRIRTLVSGRTEKELEELDQPESNASSFPIGLTLPADAQDWQLIPITADILIFSRRGYEPTIGQRRQIEELLRPEPAKTMEWEGLGLESFRPEAD